MTNLLKSIPRYQLCACAALALSTVASCQNTGKPEPESHVRTALHTDSAYIKVAVLRQQTFHHELISNGTITPAEKTDLRFEAVEVVEEIFVKNGQKVSKGQKIAAQSRFKLQNALGQARDNLEKSKLDLQDVLISQGYALRDSLKIPGDVMKIARIKSNYEQNVIQYELARYNLDHAVIYAPIDGVVANLFSKRHNLSPGSEPFCSVIGTKGLEADFKILESELAIINLGDPVQISPFAISNYHISGSIQEINPVVDENGMVRIRALIQGNTHKLYDGMNIKIKIQQSAGRQLVIPKTALVLRNNRKVVFTAKNGRAFWNYVETGMENATGYIVTDGLQVGDSVIYEGNLNLAHETPVVLRE